MYALLALLQLLAVAVAACVLYALMTRGAR